VVAVSLLFLHPVTLTGADEILFDVRAPLPVFAAFIADATLTLALRALRCAKPWEVRRS